MKGLNTHAVTVNPEFVKKKMTEYQVYSLNKSTQNEGRKTNYP